MSRKQWREISLSHYHIPTVLTRLLQNTHTYARAHTLTHRWESGEAEDAAATGLWESCVSVAASFLLNDMLRVNRGRRRRGRREKRQRAPAGTEVVIIHSREARWPVQNLEVMWPRMCDRAGRFKMSRWKIQRINFVALRQSCLG